MLLRAILMTPEIGFYPRHPSVQLCYQFRADGPEDDASKAPQDPTAIDRFLDENKEMIRKKVFECRYVAVAEAPSLVARIPKREGPY